MLKQHGNLLKNFLWHVLVIIKVVYCKTVFYFLGAGFKNYEQFSQRISGVMLIDTTLIYSTDSEHRILFVMCQKLQT